jgi:DNA-binding MarR family transcriptional regulator
MTGYGGFDAGTAPKRLTSSRARNYSGLPTKEAEMSATRRLVMDMVAKHPEMTWRQVGVLVLACEAPKEAPQTVRGMAAALTAVSPDRPVSKPAVTRALDRLGSEELDMVRRKRDPADARSVLAIPTAAGREFVKRLLAA